MHPSKRPSRESLTLISAKRSTVKASTKSYDTARRLLTPELQRLGLQRLGHPGQQGSETGRARPGVSRLVSQGWSKPGPMCWDLRQWQWYNDKTMIGRGRYAETPRDQRLAVRRVSFSGLGPVTKKARSGGWTPHAIIVHCPRRYSCWPAGPDPIPCFSN